MKRQLRGVVTSDKCSKTRRVEVARRYKHPKYGKIVRGRTVCHVHDENDESVLGDTVDIEECRPMSKLKRWTLVKVVKHGLDAIVDVDSDDVKEVLAPTAAKAETDGDAEGGEPAEDSTETTDGGDGE